MIDTELKVAMFSFLLSIFILPFVIGVFGTSARPVPPPRKREDADRTKRNGPEGPKQLDTPTHTRREIDDMRTHGFKVVRETPPPPFAELRPMPTSKDEKKRVSEILRP